MPDQEPIPLLRSNEEQLAKMRKRLEGMFDELYLIHDVMILVGGAWRGAGSDHSIEVEHVVRRCCVDRMFGQMKSLTSIIERLGGRTQFTEDAEEDRRVQRNIDTHKMADVLDRVTKALGELREVGHEQE